MQRPRPQTRSARLGFITPDAVMGLAILAVLAGALFVALNRRQRAGDRLSDTRGAAWAAEQALVQMQAGGKPAVGDGNTVAVETIAGDESAPAGYAWVRVRGERNGRTSTLTGLVPRANAAAAAEGGQK